MPLRNMILRAATLVLGGLMGLVLVEGLAWVADRIGYGSQVVAEQVHRDKDLLRQIEEGHSPLAPDARTILVLGDSMAFSPGVSQAQVWSTLLAEQLREEVDPKAVVINAALPGANSYQELLLARKLLPKLHPEVVLMIYNLNDVYGTHGPLDLPDAAALPMPATPNAARPPLIPRLVDNPLASTEMVMSKSSLSRLVSFFKRNFRTLQLLIPRVNMQLKARGYLMPGTDTHHMINEAYRDGFEGWKSTRQELVKLNDACREMQAKFLIYVIPDFDSLKYDHSVAIRQILGDYARSIGVPIGFGFDSFRDRGAEELAISPFDGHPNPKANREVAKVIADWLASTGAFRKRGG